MYVVVVVVVSRSGVQGSGTLSINMFIEVGNRDIIKAHQDKQNRGSIKGFGFKGSVVKVVVIIILSRISLSTWAS